MSVSISSSTYDLIERLVHGRITADNWADARLRQALYSAIGTKLSASDADPEQVRRYQAALSAVSDNVEASAKVATNFDDFLELKAAARAATLSPLSDASAPQAAAQTLAAPLPHSGDQIPDSAASQEAPAVQPQPVPKLKVPDADVAEARSERAVAANVVAENVVAVPRSLPVADKVDDRPVRTIPLWLIMGAVALLALGYAFWPSGARCNLRSTTCETERVVTSGPGLTEEDARLLRFAVLNVQATSTHVFARVRIHNTGTRTVNAVSPQPLRFAFRLRPMTQAAASLRLEQFNPNRIEITQDIAPGATIEVPLLAARPAGTAALALELTFVVESRFWAFQIGIEPVAVPVP